MTNSIFINSCYHQCCYYSENYQYAAAGGRWRCLQYWLRRTRLNLALLDQLDLIGRTAELARAFGIDFFSVLSRGSQYRVESMMVRLAHTQNYLMLSPAKEQVHPPVPAAPTLCAHSLHYQCQLHGSDMFGQYPNSIYIARVLYTILYKILGQPP